MLPILYKPAQYVQNEQQCIEVPQLAFGRTDVDGARLWLPFSVEVHHALMDGLHVGRYVQGLEAALLQPRRWLAEAER